MDRAHPEVVDNSLVYSRSIVEESNEHNCRECLHFSRNCDQILVDAFYKAVDNREQTDVGDDDEVILHCHESSRGR